MYKKICKYCLIEQDIKEFKRSTRRCRSCYNLDNKIYYKNNKERILEYRRNHYKNNKDVVYRYLELNKEKIKKGVKEYKRNRRNNDPLYRLSNNLSVSIRRSLTKNKFTKKSKTYTILGCDRDFFKSYVENLFEDWMNWDNYGKYNGNLNYGWDLDHIIPKSSAKTEEDIVKLNHYTNFKPLCSMINRNSKRNNWVAFFKKKQPTRDNPEVFILRPSYLIRNFQTM